MKKRSEMPAYSIVTMHDGKRHLLHRGVALHGVCGVVDMPAGAGLVSDDENLGLQIHPETPCVALLIPKDFFKPAKTTFDELLEVVDGETQCSEEELKQRAADGSEIAKGILALRGNG